VDDAANPVWESIQSAEPDERFVMAEDVRVTTSAYSPARRTVAFAISDRALYLPTRTPSMLGGKHPPLERVPLADVEAVDITARDAAAVYTGLAFSAVTTALLFLATLTVDRGTGIRWYPFAIGAVPVLFFLPAYFRRHLRVRRRGRRTFAWTPPPGSPDVKARYLEIIDRFLESSRVIGIPGASRS
jgi:hypothetical protein